MKTALIAFAGLLLLASPSRAELTGIELTPPSPHVGESVTVRVTGVMADLCWTLVDHVCGDVVGQGVGITLHTYDRSDRGGGPCYYEEVPIEVSCMLVFETAGDYVIRAEEIPDSLRCGSLPAVEVAVQITESVAVESTSWSALKTRYR